MSYLRLLKNLVSAKLRKVAAIIGWRKAEHYELGTEITQAGKVRMTQRTSDDSDQAAQAIAELMEKDPIGAANAFDQMARLSYMASGSKPSMEAAGMLHASFR